MIAECDQECEENDRSLLHEGGHMRVLDAVPLSCEVQCLGSRDSVCACLGIPMDDDQWSADRHAVHCW